MNNQWQGIRAKIVGVIFLSVVLTAITTSILFIIVVMLNRVPTFRPYVAIIYEVLGIVPVTSITAAFLFVIYIIVLTWGHIRYLVKITDAVKQLAQGRLDYRIEVRSQDELGQLASNINDMARQLQASLEEERLAVKGKNELITNVSHDLRTPLTSIMGYLQLINEDRYQDEVELRHYVDIAYEKSQRLNRLVNDLFEYTRMGYGQTVLVRHEIDLLELIGQLAADFTLQLSDANMKLRLVLPEDKLHIYADGDKLMRALENIISNAIKYGKEGKKLEISVARDSAATAAVIRIVNYGPLIPAHDLPYIFERFYRADKSRSDENGGSGLGLAIVKSIIDLHEGSINVFSNERETAFVIQLPLSNMKSI